ncbi:Phosphatidylinositol-glycan biosynthesis class F protein [Holothuria leucospilota]|uniref:Phosphatidylinositol-glycan biosynthesis class F protein n=1 Tax=Holothuria leucospilota TaxID=206669 RepID=A0A9Q1CIQ7_HOLLE|nr:Phosphatidylinositol-glycan biosynthesis class F protein [Holothuria leucospilota]
MFSSYDNLKFSHRLYNLVKAFFIFLFSCIAFHAVTVLYGAPAFEAVEETFLFSLLVSTLSIFPCLLVIGTSSAAWSRLYFDRKPEDETEICLLCLVICTYLGAWFGAFPIPLDWDRPWQAWPITVCVGSLWGHTLGVCVSIFQLLHRISDQNQPEKLR